MKMPLISVIVPAYNAERWLYECGQSVLGQSYERVELVIVDDGSTDDTLRVANELAEKAENVKVIHTENGGVCRARNVGLDAADGELVAFLDADDSLFPDALEKLYQWLITEQGDIAVGTYTSDADGNASDETKESIVWTGEEALKQSLSDHPATYSACGKLFRRDVIKNVRFVPGKRVHEDSFFVFECLLQKPRVVVREESVFYYRPNCQSASRAPFSEKFFDILNFAERKRALIAEHYPQYTDLAKNMWIKANMALLQNLCKSDGRRYRKEEKACIRAVIENKNHFIPATAFHRRWFAVITHHLYTPYKWLWKLKQRFFSR